MLRGALMFIALVFITGTLMLITGAPVFVTGAFMFIALALLAAFVFEASV